MRNINIKFAELSQVGVYISNSTPTHEDNINPIAVEVKVQSLIVFSFPH